MTLRGRWRTDAGGALVELALVLPVLILVFVGTVDFGRVFYASQSLTNAARAGAQYGAASASRSGDFAGMESTAEAATNLSGVTAAASRLCQCATNAGVFSATSPAANTCHQPAAVSCPGGGHLVVTVTVVTTKTFTTVMSGGLPGFMQSMTLTRSATQRAQ
jgi:Flp pilus assembly protein TadG